MLRIYLIAQFSFFVSACGAGEILNSKNKTLLFEDIESNYVVTDKNNYHCKKIDKKIIKHILSKGVEVTNREIHDHYSTSGCTIEGTLKINNKNNSFSFDYGGHINIGNDMIVGCAKDCCANKFKYCTWESNDLK